MINPFFMFATRIENSYPNIRVNRAASIRLRSLVATICGGPTSRLFGSLGCISCATAHRFTAAGSGLVTTTEISPTRQWRSCWRSTLFPSSIFATSGARLGRQRPEPKLFGSV